jgi:hypothetical protein
MTQSFAYPNTNMQARRGEFGKLILRHARHGIPKYFDRHSKSPRSTCNSIIHIPSTTSTYRVGYLCHLSLVSSIRPWFYRPFETLLTLVMCSGVNDSGSWRLDDRLQTGCPHQEARPTGKDLESMFPRVRLSRSFV